MKKLLRYDELKARGIVRNRMTLWRWIQKHGFPQAIELGPNSVAWDEAAVDAWLRQRPARSTSAPTAA
jgi:predicted DNA-binding transcriptional regulator AlpA